MRDSILRALETIENGYSLCGVVDRRGRVHPLGTDTKVLSALFEIVARQAVAAYAQFAGLILKEPEKQNHYPDFTLMKDEADQEKIALDVKTTYRRDTVSPYGFTLGSYTSYIRPETARKNIVYPYGDYKEHWVIGFVYLRVENRRNPGSAVYSFDELQDIPAPFSDVEVFMQEKWRIAGDRPGSGNTTNIGSIRGTTDDFRSGKGLFASEEEYLTYWQGYRHASSERRDAYSNIREFRAIGRKAETP